MKISAILSVVLISIAFLAQFYSASPLGGVHGDNENSYYLGQDLSALLRVRNVPTRLDDIKRFTSLPQERSLFATSESSQKTVKQFLVRVQSESDKDWIEQHAGHTLGEYIGDKNVYIVNADASIIQSQWDKQDSRWKELVVGQYRPEHKYIEEHFADRVLPTTRAAIAKAVNKLRNGKSMLKSDGPSGDEREDDDWRLSIDINEEQCILINVLLEQSVPMTQIGMKKARDVQAQQVADEIRDALESSGYLPSRVNPVSHEKITVLTRRKDALSVARLLSTHPAVHWIEVTGKSSVFNRDAKWITESKVKDSYPITGGSKRLTGAGEIIGVADSGLDWNSCFFYDAGNPEPPFVSSPNETISGEHRKIRGYWGMMDKIAPDTCHGTHVAGTALGQVPSGTNDELSPFNGLAEDAQILFTDMECNDPAGCKCHGVGCGCDIFPNGTCPLLPQIITPSNLETGLFPFSYENGARIHTNSWGSRLGTGYSSTSREIDSFAHKHKDFLILFAAGNDIPIGVSPLSGEAESKNALVVGASMNALESYVFNAEHLTDAGALASSSARQVYEAMRCSNNSLTPQICEFLENFNNETCCSTEGYCAGLGGNGCGCRIIGFADLGSICCKRCVIENIQKEKDFENLASFSSRGPTSDQRIKPDIVAPGEGIISAASHHTVNSPQVCGTVPGDDLPKHLRSSSGSSLATPLVAGAAALVRQFFREGYWKTGNENISFGFLPSSALLKAVLINSGQRLLGMLGDTKVQDYPNPKRLEGFGRVQLDKVLVFDDSPSSHKLLVIRKSSQDFSQDPSLSDGSFHDYCVNVKEGGSELKATLVWTDPPKTPAADKQLVNDLDLAVVDADDDVWRGNSDEKNNNEDRDSLNNVEQIRIDNAKAGSYVFHVEAFEVPQGPQPYALVVTGNVELVQCPSDNEYDRRTESPPEGSPESSPEGSSSTSDAGGIDGSFIQTISNVLVSILFLLAVL